MANEDDALEISSDYSEGGDRVSPLASVTGKCINNPPHMYSLNSALKLLAPSSSSFEKDSLLQKEVDGTLRMGSMMQKEL